MIMPPDKKGGRKGLTHLCLLLFLRKSCAKKGQSAFSLFKGEKVCGIPDLFCAKIAYVVNCVDLAKEWS